MTASPTTDLMTTLSITDAMNTLLSAGMMTFSTEMTTITLLKLGQNYN